MWAPMWLLIWLLIRPVHAVNQTETGMQYDYIIVGAGSGGCSLASRLADSCPDATIALIEAGPHTDRNMFVNMPTGVAAVVPFKLKTNYGYETEPQSGLAGRRGYQPRGRGFG